MEVRGAGLYLQLTTWIPKVGIVTTKLPKRAQAAIVLHTCGVRAMNITGFTTGVVGDHLGSFVLCSTESLRDPTESKKSSRVWMLPRVNFRTGMTSRSASWQTEAKKQAALQSIEEEFGRAEKLKRSELMPVERQLDNLSSGANALIYSSDITLSYSSGVVPARRAALVLSQYVLVSSRASCLTEAARWTKQLRNAASKVSLSEVPS